MDLKIAFADARGIEQPIDERHESPHLLAGFLEDLGRRRIAPLERDRGRLEEDVQRVHRRAQFMRGDREELISYADRFARLRQVQSSVLSTLSFG
jgi:hypothetical protein